MPAERRERAIAICSGQPATGGTRCSNGRRQPSCDGTSRMNREVQVRFCEGLGVKFPGPTRHFATHGLVAGDVAGLGEPSLALTLPTEPTELDDGLLTASEVALLKLNADWVVLSACNTAAADKPGTEALSGLARAFFYAGARALLVSHWSVHSEAATRLTTSTFAIMKADPRLGRAEALRNAMLASMNDKSNPLSAYPAFWAPFSIIGEGAAR